MCTSFTEHVRDFGADCDPEGCVLPRLEQLLRQRMRRRNLLAAPPAYLGYGGVPSWDAPGAFEDLGVDCYVFAFLDRLQGLRNQLRVRMNVDGLITRNVDNFLLARQRRNDPVGYAVFGNVEGAVSELAATGKLTVDGADGGRLRGTSVLRLDPSAPTAEPADPRTLQDVLAAAPGWGNVLPELVFTTVEGQQWVAEFLAGLPSGGVVAVRVAELVSVIAARAREDWAARNAIPRGALGYEGDDDLGTLVRLVWPDTRAADRDQWEALKRLVPERIGQLERQQRVRDRLAAVFDGLVRLVEDGGPNPPTQAEVVERLGVARATVSDDFRLLRDVISAIRAPNPESG